MGVRELYESLAGSYRALYIDHPAWAAKHARNVELLRELLRPGMTWLDTCCGQAWHFTQIEDVVRIGVDLSPAQLAIAHRDNPNASFLEADILGEVAREALEGARFDLVTNFWGAYSYLDDTERIAELLRRLVGWTRPGGSLYLELITPAALAAFDATHVAGEIGGRVELRSPDGVAWRYRDPGGVHELTSPPAAFFVEHLSPWFADVRSRGTVATMEQLVATGRYRIGQ